MSDLSHVADPSARMVDVSERRSPIVLPGRQGLFPHVTGRARSGAEKTRRKGRVWLWRGSPA